MTELTTIAMYRKDKGRMENYLLAFAKQEKRRVNYPEFITLLLDTYEKQMED